MRHELMVGVVLACAFTAQEVRAETATEAAPEDIVVTGVREKGYGSDTQSAALFGETSLLDTPFQVSVFPVELLQDQQVRTLFDVAKNDASVVATDAATGFFDSVAIRGFSLSNSSGYYREGLLYQNQAQSPFENKSAVEFVKGLSGLRYGFTSPGGVVNYVLKRPTPSAYRALELFGDGNGSAGGHLDLGGPIGDTLGYRFNGVVAREALFVRDTAGPRYMASLFLEWRPTDRLTVAVEGEYQFREIEQNASITIESFDDALTIDQKRDLLTRYDRRTYLGQPWTTYPTRNAIGSLRIDYRFAEDWRIRAAAQKMYLRRDQNSIDIAPGSLQANGDFVAQLYFAPDQVRDPLTAQITLEGSFDTGGLRHELVAGMYVLRNRLTFPFLGFNAPIGASNLFAPVPIADPQVTSDPSYTAIRERQISVFLTDYVQITDKLNVFAGVRYTKPRFETFFNEDLSRDSLYEQARWTPSAGVIFKPTPDVSLYASYAEGFEQGGQAPIGTVNANQVLPPLTSRQYEAGVKARVLGGATLSAAMFNIDKGLEIINDDNRFVQAGRQVHRGFEASLSGTLNERVRVVGSVQYLDARIARSDDAALLGKRPQNVPEWQGSVFVDWQLPVLGDVAVNGGLYLSDSKFADTANTFAIDGYARLDLGARYGFALGQTRTTLRLIVENVTDAKYFSGIGFAFQYAAPRTVRLALSTNF
jgi:iron complex outermembrane recepter protein